MLELAILGLLKERPTYGYELKKRLTDVMGPLSRFSFGSLYPALNRLNANGAVRAVDGPAAPAGPATGSLGAELAAFRARHASPLRSRGKKVYEITERGAELFDELLAAGHTVDDDRSFGLRLAFARYLAPDARLRLLERRRAHLVEQLAQARASMDGESRDAYTSSLIQHTTETTEADISWLDRLIAAERGRDAPRTATV